MNDGPAAIEITALTKRYGALTAVDGVSLRVEPGEFFGLLGPNGAGKTSTINAIVGLATITSGRVAVFGRDVQTEWRAARRLIGLAPQEYTFDRYLSIRDVLLYAAGYYGLRRREVARRADALLDRFGLAAKAGETYVKLSGGMKRRLSLARALVHEPRILILDEPTAGVDVELRLELWDLLRELNAAGTTIVLTTHYLEEAELLCRTIAIIEGGRVAAHAPTAELLAGRGEANLSVTLAQPLERLPEALVARGARAEAGGALVRVDGVPGDEIANILAALGASGARILDVSVGRPSLQDVFLEIVGRGEGTAARPDGVRA